MASAGPKLPILEMKMKCHPACPGLPWDRSVAKWRDLQFNGPALEMFYPRPDPGGRPSANRFIDIHVLISLNILTVCTIPLGQ